MSTQQTLGMTLAGGGARGAYSAGVLRFLLREFPKNLGYTPWPQLVSGTSVGALNGYFAASHSMVEVYRMTDLWTTLRPNQIFEMPAGGAFRVIRRLLKTARGGSILSNEPLRQIIISEAKRRTLRQSISSGKCTAFIVSATHLTSGMNTLFVETADPNFSLPPPPRGNIIYTKIYPEHLLGTIAIPLVFPPEKIDGRIYVDGGVRQNTPVRPIIHSGANKILVLSTRAEKPYTPDLESASISLVAGKTLNALTLDPVERDLSVTQKINSIINLGVEHYGEDFASLIQNTLNVRQTNILKLYPSINLGKLVIDVYNPQKIQASSGAKWMFAKLFDQGKHSGESDLLSQFLFDASYTAEIEQLGFNDTKAREEEIAQFLLRE